MSKVTRIEHLVKRMGRVLTIEPSAPVAAAAKLMKSNGIGCLVVVDANEVVGIITERDIIEQVVATSADPATTEVRKIMTDYVVTCSLDTPISEAEQIMGAHSIRHLPIMEGGVSVGMVSSRDIFTHELQEAKTRLAQASKQVRAAKEARSRLLSNVSYEIRTPMNGIIGMTELAMDTPLTAEQRDCLSIVKHSAESLLGMINNLVDFSKMSRGEVELETVEFELRDQIGRMIRTLGRRAEVKGLDLICKISPDVPERVIGDPGRLSQILVNLVTNAIKFTDSGSVTVRIETAEWTPEGAVLEFTVADTGIGIPPQKQEVIFDGFRHVEESYTRTHEGLGLGLAISSQLVSQMGGKLRVESEVGKGSSFHFTASLKLQKPPGEWRYTSRKVGAIQSESVNDTAPES